MVESVNYGRFTFIFYFKGSDLMFILLFFFWILLNGKINLELSLIGLIICITVYTFSCVFLNFSFKKDIRLCKMIGLVIYYAFCLLLEVIKSNLNIITFIWSNKEADPKIVHFDVKLKKTYLRVLFANSITLTPGTITINLKEDEFVVHALRYEYISGIENSKLLRILQKMEGVQ